MHHLAKPFANINFSLILISYILIGIGFGIYDLIVLKINNYMINQYEVPAIIADELPELKPELKFLPNLGNIFKAMQILADYVNKMATLGKLENVKKCMLITEKIYERGNMVVKNAVENVFVFSFSSVMDLCNREERKSLQALMPLSLHTLYVQQVLRPGI